MPLENQGEQHESNSAIYAIKEALLSLATNPGFTSLGIDNDRLIKGLSLLMETFGEDTTSEQLVGALKTLRLMFDKTSHETLSHLCYVVGAIRLDDLDLILQGKSPNIFNTESRKVVRESENEA